MSLYKHFELLELPNLYPTAEKYKLSSFSKIDIPYPTSASHYFCDCYIVIIHNSDIYRDFKCKCDIC